MENHWYISIEGKAEGPFSLEQLRQKAGKGELKGDNYVWNPSYTEWLRANQSTELFELFVSPPPPPVLFPPPPPISDYGNLQDSTLNQPAAGRESGVAHPAAEPAARKKKRRSLKWALVAVLALLLIGIGVFVSWRLLNPGLVSIDDLHPIARTLLETPPDDYSTAVVNNYLEMEGLSQGVEAAVIPLPDEEGNPADDMGNLLVLSINRDGRFETIGTVEGMQMQAMQIAWAISDANWYEELDVVLVECSFYNKNLAVASMFFSMASVDNWVDGLISDEEFLGRTYLMFHDARLMEALTAQ